jgi:hypothetical protein
MTDVPTYKKILPILFPSMVEAENVSDHPRTCMSLLGSGGFCYSRSCQKEICFSGTLCLLEKPRYATLFRALLIVLIRARS